MFKILQKTVTTGIATVAYPDVPAVVSSNFRGRPEFDFPSWRDARPAAEVCPTGAIALSGDDATPPRHRRLRPLHLLRAVRRCFPRWRRARDHRFRTRHAQSRQPDLCGGLQPQSRRHAQSMDRRLSGGGHGRIRRARKPARQSTRPWDARSPSARWTPDRATDAKSRSWRSTIPFTISNVSAFTLWPRRGMPTCCWSPARSRATWNWRC